MATQQQIILITGASSGIGLVTTSSLVISTATNHVIMGVRNLAKGEKRIQELQSSKPRGTFSLLELDVTSDDSIEAAVKQVSRDFGRIDVLINNAGIADGDAHPTRTQLRSLFETNVYGPTILTHALTPLLQKSAAPKVINITSELGSIHGAATPGSRYYGGGNPGYNMSKAALNMLTARQYQELKEFGCKVWCFCPGFVVSNLGGPEIQEQRKQMGAEDPQTSADGLVEIVQGKRDGEVGMFIGRRGEQYAW